MNTAFMGPDRAGQSSLPVGLYEALLTRRIAAAISGLGQRARLDSLPVEDAPHVLASHVARAVMRALRAVGGPDDRARLELQVALCNRILELIGQPPGDARAVDGDDVAAAKLLLAVLGEGALRSAGPGEPIRPATPLPRMPCWCARRTSRDSPPSSSVRSSRRITLI